MKAVFKTGATFLILILLALSSKSQNIDTVKNAETVLPPGANVAVKYNYDMPVTLLDHQKQLGLTADQIIKLKKIESTFQLKKVETHSSAKRNEQTLDSLFQTGRINEGVIIFYTNRYGLYEGEYRGAVLLACYEAHKVLTPLQLTKLAALKNPY